jgi:hypothetical protein
MFSVDTRGGSTRGGSHVRLKDKIGCFAVKQPAVVQKLERVFATNMVNFCFQHGPLESIVKNRGGSERE